MHGQGKFTFASGASYEGTWEHNKYQGQGKYIFSDGKSYQVSAINVPVTLPRMHEAALRHHFMSSKHLHMLCYYPGDHNDHGSATRDCRLRQQRTMQNAIVVAHTVQSLGSRLATLGPLQWTPAIQNYLYIICYQQDSPCVWCQQMHVLAFLLLLSLQGDWILNVMHGQGTFTDTEGHNWAGQFHNGAGPGLTYQL